MELLSAVSKTHDNEHPTKHKNVKKTDKGIKLQSEVSKIHENEHPTKHKYVKKTEK